MRDDNLKKHKNRKHSNFDTSLHNGEVRPIADLVIDNQHGDEVKAEDSEIEELDYTPLHHDAKLEFELHRGNKYTRRMLKLDKFLEVKNI